MSGFDWPALMRAGMRGAGLAPEAFWRLTPVELLILLGVDPGRDQRQGPMTRAGLSALLAAFPDERRMTR
ncbi:MAG: phage tail assembly chaperone [Paracoccaceae bacterium]|nr:phage tail assembly chaperone [Paracoccaceae bacterium]MDE3121573.1 phage tail assembly chaperone [Paracoccaceae bacterium]MDE3237352.1 phage tail assembly chaperone [Paracoccaceae bacterium]